MINEQQGDRARDEQRSSWFAVRVRSNYERIVATHLRERGFDEFTPSYQTQRRWSDRIKTIEQYLFPGYVFSRFNPQDRLPVLTVPGVVGLVGMGKTPSPIPDQEVENIRRMVQSGLLVRPWPFLEVGQRVLIERGPLASVEGILREVKGKFRLVVSISLLHRAVSAEIDRTWVRPIRPSPSFDGSLLSSLNGSARTVNMLAMTEPQPIGRLCCFLWQSVCLHSHSSRSRPEAKRVQAPPGGTGANQTPSAGGIALRNQSRLTRSDPTTRF